MKKNSILLALISFLVQSCVSYIPVRDFSKLEVGKHYKVKVENKTTKVILKNISDSTIIVSNKNIDNTVAISKIEKIKRRKFSIAKTVVLVPTTVVAIALISYVVDPKIGMGEITIDAP
jgi:hypothetical protein